MGQQNGRRFNNARIISLWHNELEPLALDPLFGLVDHILHHKVCATWLKKRKSKSTVASKAFILNARPLPILIGKGEAVTAAMQPYARFGVNVNVDFYTGVTYYLSGITQDPFVPIFAAGRLPGWVAQCLEQQRSNILIRPLTEYYGPEPRPYQPIVSRQPALT